MKTHPGLLKTLSEIQELADELQGESMIALDTEFIRESTFFPGLEIIQVASSKKSWLIDAQAFRGEAKKNLLPFLNNVLENPKILKILHAAQADQECFYTSYGVLARPLLDTSIAASLCGYGDSPGLGVLLKNALDVKIKKGHSRTNWAVRPLPEHLLEYAHEDVHYLIPLGIHFLSHLEKLGRKEWALEQCSKYENKKEFESSPDEMAMRLFRGGRVDKRNYPCLVHLMRWRERRTRELNIPRRWLADDAILIDLSNVKPKDLDHLQSFRGIHKGEIKKNGQQILDAIKQGLSEPDLLPPQRDFEASLSPGQEAAVKLVECLLGYLAEQKQIAPRHLLVQSQIIELIRRPPKTIEDLWKNGPVSKGASDLVGRELFELLTGKSMITIDGGVLKVLQSKE